MKTRANTSSSSSYSRTEPTHDHLATGNYGDLKDQPGSGGEGLCTNHKTATTKYFFLGAGTRYTKFLDKSKGFDP